MSTISGTPTGGADGQAFIHKGDSLIAMAWPEFERRIKHCTKLKMSQYLRSLKKEAIQLQTKYETTYRDWFREHCDCEILRKKIKDNENSKSAINEKNKNHKHHIKSLQKSLDKERKKLDKYKRLFEEYKEKAKKSRKKLQNESKKLEETISLKEKYIERMCYKLAMYKDRLSQFEIPVFSEYLILLSPNDTAVAQYNANYNLNLNHHTSMLRKHGTIDGMDSSVMQQNEEDNDNQNDTNNNSNNNNNNNNSNTTNNKRNTNEIIVNPKLQAQAAAWYNGAFPKTRSQGIPIKIKSKGLNKDKNGNPIIPTSNAQSLEYFINQNNVGVLENDEMENTLNNDVLFQNSLIISQSKPKNAPINVTNSTPRRSYLESDVETRNAEGSQSLISNHDMNILGTGLSPTGLSTTLPTAGSMQSVLSAPKTTDNKGMAIIQDSMYNEDDSLSERDAGNKDSNNNKDGDTFLKIGGINSNSSQNSNSNAETETDYANQTDATYISTKSDKQQQQRERSNKSHKKKSKKSKNSSKKTRGKSMSLAISNDKSQKHLRKLSLRNTSGNSSGPNNIGVDNDSLKHQQLKRKDKKTSIKKDKESKKKHKHDRRKQNNNNSSNKHSDNFDNDDDSLDVDELELTSSSENSFDSSDINSDDNNHNGLMDNFNDVSSVESELPYSVTRYVKLLLVKYPGTHELYLVLNKQDENQDFIEIFRKDFCHVEMIRKLSIQYIYCIFTNECIIINTWLCFECMFINVYKHIGNKVNKIFVLNLIILIYFSKQTVQKKLNQL